jgi:CHAD domain-containing protein
MAAAKEIEGLDCAAGAHEGIALVLRTRFGEMYDLRGEALGHEDAKGVHDMRVASRRLRSALRDFGGFYERKGLPRRRLREVAGALGEVRDQDVAVDALRKLQPEAGDAAAEGIEHLINERRELRERGRVRLGPVLAEGPLGELQQKFFAWLERLGGGHEKRGARRAPGTAHGKSFRQAGVEVIESRLAELLELGDSVYHPFDLDPLHEMRIAAKRLRYALELFSPCWGGALKPIAHEVSELQGALGDLRDCDAWIDDLGPRLDRRRDPSEAIVLRAADLSVRPAAAWLLDRFTKERGEHFSRALTLWQEWEARNFFGQVRETLHGARPAAPPDLTPEPSARG